ncbi:MAG: homoserine kinase [Methylococcaceae bacterium]
MSVYTRINQQQLETLLSLYPIGKLINFSGIKAGIENTNYNITTTQGEFILTIYESLTAKQLPAYLLLLTNLSLNDFPSPKPQACRRNKLFSCFNGKPAALFNRLPGRSIDQPSIIQCREIGEYLAKLHMCSKQLNFNKQNQKNLAGYQSVFHKIKSQLAKDDITLLNSELNFQSTYVFPDLPQGVIHADLFKDNVLFERERISGIVDFYNACTDYFLFDIAVTCNDWCIITNSINQQKLNALLAGYQKVRIISDEEIKHLPVFLRLTALRFWISRLDHQLNPRKGELTLVKDPRQFRQLVEFHRANPTKVNLQ